MQHSDDEEIDPFELRLQFNDLLSRVSASQDSLARAARFATRWAKHHDVLYDALMEFIPTVRIRVLFRLVEHARSVNDRMNLFYLCDHICMMSLKAGVQDYTHCVVRDLKKIVALVCPPDGMGNVNVPNVRKILTSWRRKNVLSQGQFDYFDQKLTRRDSDRRSAGSRGRDQFSKQEIVRRMEEDRERVWAQTLSLATCTLLTHVAQHKRTKEDAWIRPVDEPFFAQFDEAWELTSELNDTDLAEIAQELEAWRASQA
ncbi:hypothetical protein RI367_000444 [Sorochytrium milnesiophthora]